MKMQIQTSKNTDKKIKEASKALGLEEDEIVNRAIAIYLDNMERFVELKKEFKDWDRLSDEAFLDFDKSL